MVAFMSSTWHMRRVGRDGLERRPLRRTSSLLDSSRCTEPSTSTSAAPMLRRAGCRSVITRQSASIRGCSTGGVKRHVLTHAVR